MSRESSMRPDGIVAGDDEGVIEIRTTFASRAAAEECAARLVERGVAACVQVHGPITSIYRWQGSIERAEEFVCTGKTTVAMATACENEIRSSHSYTTPEVLVTPCRGSAAYAAWVRESVGDRGSEGSA